MNAQLFPDDHEEDFEAIFPCMQGDDRSAWSTLSAHLFLEVVGMDTQSSYRVRGVKGVMHKVQYTPDSESQFVILSPYSGIT